MRHAVFLVEVTAFLGAVLATPAAASPGTAADPPAFASRPVSDLQLSTMRGGYLRSDAVASLADTQARADFRQISSVGTLVFDNWFNDVGSALIVNSILSR